jgi:hypothetical protein
MEAIDCGGNAIDSGVSSVVGVGNYTVVVAGAGFVD